MIENIISSLGLHYQPNIITLIGVLIAIAFLGSKIFQRFSIPQVVGFIVMGVLMGPSFLNIVPLELSNELTFISEVALGLIGFDMGSHLRFNELRRMGASLFLILIFEAFGTFILVTAGIFLVTRSFHTALIFGALSSATAPAATVDVLAEYKAKGPLTTSLLAVVGLDDALSLLLYSIAVSMTATMLAGAGMPPLIHLVELPLYEIGGALILGITAGLLLEVIMHRMKSLHDAMAISISFVFLCVGISDAIGFSLILTSMTMGLTVVNRCPDHGKKIRFTIEQAGPVVYVLFFALVGARFQVSALPSMGLLGVVYVTLRSAGKYGGAWIGGRLGRAAPQVRDNLGLGLLSQAGVAIGLAIDCCNRFSELGEEGAALGTLVITVITATTFLVQIIGPIGVKMAITRAGEVGGATTINNGWASDQ
jgi:Kef-type K+ transport system membrane component KefB